MAEHLKSIKKTYKTEEAKGIFRALLKAADFQESTPNLKTAWETFKSMCEYEFDCGGEDLLFEAGVYNFTGKDLFYLYIVRQFTLEVEDEYDYIEQLRMEFSYEPVGELKTLEERIWTYEFDDDFKAFMEAVEKSPAFLLAQKDAAPVGFELFLEEV